MPSPDDATIESLRRDVALQIARFTAGTGLTQVAAAARLRIPQPTLSKIVNGRVSDLSLELLIRVAVRAGVPLALLTGSAPAEAGAYVAKRPGAATHAPHSRLADEARSALRSSARQLTPTQRLEAFLEHNQLVAALHQAGRAAEAAGPRAAPVAR